jgi:hypothetical protein
MNPPLAIPRAVVDEFGGRGGGLMALTLWEGTFRYLTRALMSEKLPWEWLSCQSCSVDPANFGKWGLLVCYRFGALVRPDPQEPYSTSLRFIFENAIVTLRMDVML